MWTIKNKICRRKNQATKSKKKKSMVEMMMMIAAQQKNVYQGKQKKRNNCSPTERIQAPKELGQIKTVTRWTFVSFINLLNTLSRWSCRQCAQINERKKRNIWHRHVLFLSHQCNYCLCMAFMRLWKSNKNANKQKSEKKTAKHHKHFLFFYEQITNDYRITRCASSSCKTIVHLCVRYQRVTSNHDSPSLLYYRIINDSWY